MSRIGKIPLQIPSGVTITVGDSGEVTVKGPKGELMHTAVKPIRVSKQEENMYVVERPDDEPKNKALHGLTRSLISNMITGVTEGYTKKLEISGTGYRVALKGRDLEFSLGYSHSVPFSAPEGITFAVETPTLFSVTGIDKQLVGEVCAKIKKIRKIDPYKGKGIYFVGERIRRKAGKAGKKQ